VNVFAKFSLTLFLICIPIPPLLFIFSRKTLPYIIPKPFRLMLFPVFDGVTRVNSIQFDPGFAIRRRKFVILSRVTSTLVHKILLLASVKSEITSTSPRNLRIKLAYQRNTLCTREIRRAVDMNKYDHPRE
jgi:hypothetical protein